MNDPRNSNTLLSDPSQNRLADKDLKFIQMRQRFLKFSNIVGLSFSLFLGALFLWLFFKVPNMINPFEVERQIASNALSIPTIKIMAILLPMMVVLSFFLTASIILFAYWAFANERNYLKIIETLLAGLPGKRNDSTPSPKGTKELKKNLSGKKK